MDDDELEVIAALVDRRVPSSSQKCRGPNAQENPQRNGRPEYLYSVAPLGVIHCIRDRKKRKCCSTDPQSEDDKHSETAEPSLRMAILILAFSHHQYPSRTAKSRSPSQTSYGMLGEPPPKLAARRGRARTETRSQ